MSAAPSDPAHGAVAPFAAGQPRPVVARTAVSPGSAMNIKWLGLHDAAGVVAALAGLPAAPVDAATRTFPAAMRDAGGWRRALAEQGIEDLSAILQTGLAALLAVHAAGVSPQAPARALWDEFVAARDALIALQPSRPGGAAGVGLTA